MKYIYPLFFAFFLAGCGGGSDTRRAPTDPSDPDPTPTSTTEIVVTLDSVNVVNEQTNEVMVDETLFFGARVIARTSSGGSTTEEPVVDEIVNFATDGGTLSPENGRVLTDETGTAIVAMRAGNTTGAFSMQVSVAINAMETVEAFLNFQVTTIPAPEVALRFLDDSDQEVSGASLRAGQVYIVEATALSAAQAGESPTVVEDVIVTLSTDGGTFDPENGTGLTDENGQVRIRFEPGFVPGAYILSATGDVQGDEAEGNVNYQVNVPDLQLGFGDPFVEGQLGLDNGTISAGGSTAVRVQLREADGSVWTPLTEVTFVSECVSQGLAAIGGPVLSSQGMAETTYRATNCSGSDTIAAVASIQGVVLPAMASAQIAITPPELGAIEFDEIDAPSLAIQGSGTDELPERTTVTFVLLDSIGNPVVNRSVSFELTNTAGGATLQNASDLTDPNGEVDAVVISGTAAATLRVRAFVDDMPALATQSSPITISTGVPDQDSFSVSFETLNIEGFDFDGKENVITIRAADHFNNPAPDGTQVLFTTEGGAIEPFCLTQGGACSVLWISQDPRPADGRATVVARTVGDESFTDLNGNGVFDPGEPFTDLPEAWRDDNENGVRDPGSEEFFDFNTNGAYDIENGVYNGALCPELNSNCAQSRSVEVRESGVIVMSTSRAIITIDPNPIRVSNLSSQTVRIEVSDLNGNLPPAGTTIDVETANGEIVGDFASIEVANSNGRGPIVFFLTVAGDEEPSSGPLTVTVTTPMDVVTVGQATVIDSFVDPCGFSPSPPECEVGDGG